LSSVSHVLNKPMTELAAEAQEKNDRRDQSAVVKQAPS
jgi:hypothetical protein